MKENQNKDTKPKQIKRIPNIPKKPQKGSKFNIFWVYAAIIIGLLVVNFMFNSETVKEVNYATFEKDMLLTGDVEKVVSYKVDDIARAEVFIKVDKKTDPKYKKYISQNAFNTSGMDR